MKNTHKKQHFIPRSYLASWCDPHTPPGQTPYLNIISKDGSVLTKKAPANAFTENDFYTIKLPDGSRDLRLEHGLCDLEDSFVRSFREYLVKKKNIPLMRYLKLLLFVAAMHGRTRAVRDHNMDFWGGLKKKMEDLTEQFEQASPEEKALYIDGVPSTRPRIDYNGVCQLASKPMQNMLPIMVEVESPLLLNMSCTILCTSDNIGFITSDDPVVWFDPEWQRKPPMFQNACFSDPQLEITMPISPSQCLLLMHGQRSFRYLEVASNVVDELNRRVRFRCQNYYISKYAYSNPYWFVEVPPGLEAASQDQIV